MGNNSSRRAESSHFFYITPTLTRVSNASETNSQLQLTATLAIEILEFRDITRLVSLVETACEAAYSAIVYMKQEEGAGHEVSSETEAKLEEFIRTLKETLLLCRSFRNAKWSKVIAQWAVRFWDKLKATIETLSPVDHRTTQIQTLKSRLTHAVDGFNSKKKQGGSSADGAPLLFVYNTQSNHGLVSERDTDVNSHLGGPSQPQASDPPFHPPRLGHGASSPSTVSFFTGAHDFVILMSPGSSIPFTHVDGNQSIATNSYRE